MSEYTIIYKMDKERFMMDLFDSSISCTNEAVWLYLMIVVIFS